MDNQKLKKNLELIKALVEESLHELGERKSSKPKRTRVSRANETHLPSLDFGMSDRAFIKKYGKKMGGPQRFTLLLAYLTKGSIDKSIKAKEVQKHWNRMTALLDGEFNSAYSCRAKDKDWVDTKKRGEYNLRPSWERIFK